MSPGQDPLDFRPLLALDCIAEGRFRTVFEADEGEVFGGDLLGRSVMAATHTCPDKQLHSLHARFLRRVPANRPVELKVEVLSNGRRLAHRRVAIEHNDKPLFELTASFAAAHDGEAYQEAVYDEQLTPPEALPSEQELAVSIGWDDWEPWVMEWRWSGDPPALAKSSRWDGWVRLSRPEYLSSGELAAALVHMSDVHSDWSASRASRKDACMATGVGFSAAY